MAPPEPAVVSYATEYVRIRAFGVFVALIGFVATGTYRGIKVCGCKHSDMIVDCGCGCWSCSHVFHMFFKYRAGANIVVGVVPRFLNRNCY
jgi:hypothetical protein